MKILPEARIRIAFLPMASPTTPASPYWKVRPGLTTRLIHALSAEGMPKFHIGVATTSRWDASSSSINWLEPSRFFIPIGLVRISGGDCAQREIVEVRKVFGGEVAADDLGGRIARCDPRDEAARDRPAQRNPGLSGSPRL